MPRDFDDDMSIGRRSPLCSGQALAQSAAHVIFGILPNNVRLSSPLSLVPQVSYPAATTEVATLA